uniref:Uncharacterized protein n=1 Tax=Mycena chlorophos TaxID=658473 RepID=A0ABQ0LXW6_MYCCL|nr:predicted protein [Mycena chlorophos]
MQSSAAPFSLALSSPTDSEPTMAIDDCAAHSPTSPRLTLRVPPLKHVIASRPKKALPARTVSTQIQGGTVDSDCAVAMDVEMGDV